MSSNSVDRLVRAIQTGVPVPATDAQRSELVANENASALSHAQRLAKRESEAREWVRDQLLAWAESECPAIKARKVWEPWFVAMLAHHRFGTKPTWAHDSRDNCETCGIAMDWQECELSADPDDGRVGYRSVCPCCGKGEDAEPRTKREIAEDAA